MTHRTPGIHLTIFLVSLLAGLMIFTLFLLLAVSGTLGSLSYLMVILIGLNQSQLPRLILQSVGKVSILGFAVWMVYSPIKK